MAKFPSFTNIKPVDQDGERTPEQQMYDDQLAQTLQNNFSDNGVVIPPQSAPSITSLAPFKPTAFWVDTTNGELVGKINGALYKFTKTPWP